MTPRPGSCLSLDVFLNTDVIAVTDTGLLDVPESRDEPRPQAPAPANKKAGSAGVTSAPARDAPPSTRDPPFCLSDSALPLGTMPLSTLHRLSQSPPGRWPGRRPQKTGRAHPRGPDSERGQKQLRCPGRVGVSNAP